MTFERFEAILDAYGGDPNRWPAEERAAALAFAAGEEAARRAWEAARAFDAVLDAAPSAHPSELLAARLLRAAPRPMVAPWRLAAALAACAVFGVALGVGGARGLEDGAEAAFADAFAPAWEIEG